VTIKLKTDAFRCIGFFMCEFFIEGRESVFATVTAFVAASVEDTHDTHTDETREACAGEWDGDRFGLCEVVEQCD